VTAIGPTLSLILRRLTVLRVAPDEPPMRSNVGRAAFPQFLRPEGGAVTLSKEMLEAHPLPAQVDRDLLAGCIDECLACLQSCTACADASVAEDDVPDMRKCIRLCLDCADVCAATARTLSRQTEYVASTSRAQVSSCLELCAICAAECGHHAAHHDHCRLCAEQCRRCEEACSVLVDAIPG
jgi:hypothetical protein